MAKLDASSCGPFTRRPVVTSSCVVDNWLRVAFNCSRAAAAAVLVLMELTVDMVALLLLTEIYGTLPMGHFAPLPKKQSPCHEMRHFGDG
jgi:hypothetical protein